MTATSTMGRKLANVINLYVEGVIDGRLRTAADRYLSVEFSEHTVSGCGGRDTFVAAYQPLVRHDRRFVRPLRGFQDGNSVVLHMFQSFGYRDVERVTLDIFDTDDQNRVVGHWSVASPLAPLSIGGYSQIDGPTQIEDLGRTEANKHLVAAYVTQVLIGKRPERADRFRSSDWVDHQAADPTAQQWPSDSRRQSANCEVTPVRAARLLGCGNYVAVLSHVRAGAHDTSVCDLYRVEDGLIVEHWDTSQSGSMCHTSADRVRATGADRIELRSAQRRNHRSDRPGGSRQLHPAAREAASSWVQHGRATTARRRPGPAGGTRQPLAVATESVDSSDAARAPGEPPSLSSTPSSCTITCTRTPAGTVGIRVAGELDTRSAPRLQMAIHHAIAAGANPAVVLDLGDVRFLDCSAITVLASAHRTAAAAGTSFRIIGATGAVAEILYLAGIRDL